MLLLGGCGPAGPADVRISDAWARETVAGQSATAAYVTISNEGGTADRLVSVAAEAPARASLHATSNSGGVARMRPLGSGLEIPAGKTVALEPGGAHIMLEGLTYPLGAGGTLPITLRFERSGERTVPVWVRDSTTSGPAQQDR